MASFLEQQMNEASLLMEDSSVVNEASVLPIISSKSTTTTSVPNRDDDDDDTDDQQDNNDDDDDRVGTNRALEVTSFLERQINEASELILDDQYNEDTNNHTTILQDNEKVEENHDADAVQDLADRLAPSMEELDALLDQQKDGSMRSLNKKMVGTLKEGDEDDDENSFDSELEHLAASEHILRQELEFAHDFGSMLNVSGESHMGEEEEKDMNGTGDDDDAKEGNDEESAPTAAAETKNDEGDTDSTGSKSTGSKSVVTRHNYTLSDHSHYLQIQTEARGGWYHRPISFDALAGREYIIPLPEQELDRIYVGLQPTSIVSQPSSFAVSPLNNFDTPKKKKKSKDASLVSGEDESIPFERLPLRVIGFKLRPDVLVGTVMDAINHALKEEPYELDVKKRQGGHLILRSPVLEFDFQIASYKGTTGSRFCERTLLIRVFYLNHDEVRAPPPTDSHFMLAIGDAGDIKDLLDNESNWTLREASALIQKMETSKKSSDAEHFFSTPFWVKKPVFPNKKAMQDAIAQQLLEKFKPSPSVGSFSLTLPCLSKEDWPWIQYSYRYIKSTWDELDDRDLTYASLRSRPFGQFPSLTTLDVHYCSQLRRISREQMVLSLLRSASDLEQYAREAEFTCANLIEVLKTAYDNYKLEPPKLPQALPLVAYPLEFTPHQETCPPWGQKVTEAVNEITKQSSSSTAFDADSNDSSFSRAEQAVQLVLNAFQFQHDEEQSARLGRKNVQVMDRLAKMQAHKQASIDKLQQSYHRSAAARKAADEFYAMGEKAKYGSDVFPPPDVPKARHVPLFKCSVLVRGSTGSFTVTANHILCCTQLVPLVGGNRIKLLELQGLAFSVQGNQSSGFNPLPDRLIVRRDGEEVLTFRPSYAASRLKVFLEIIQGFSENSGVYSSGQNKVVASSSSTSNTNNDKGDDSIQQEGDEDEEEDFATKGTQKEEEESDSPAQDEPKQDEKIGEDDTKQDDESGNEEDDSKRQEEKNAMSIKEEEEEEEETPIVEREPISNSTDVEETTKTTSIDDHDDDAETDDHESACESHQIDSDTKQDENGIKEEDQILEKEEETEKEDSR